MSFLYWWLNDIFINTSSCLCMSDIYLRIQLSRWIDSEFFEWLGLDDRTYHLKLYKRLICFNSVQNNITFKYFVVFQYTFWYKEKNPRVVRNQSLNLEIRIIDRRCYFFFNIYGYIFSFIKISPAKSMTSKAESSHVKCFDVHL